MKLKSVLSNLYIPIFLFFGYTAQGNYSDQASDYLVIGMVVAPFSYGIHKHNKDMLIASGIAHLSTFSATQLTKYVVHRTRPDQSNDNSFWSGHTAQSATSAGLMCTFKKKTCLPFIGLATSVGLLRYTAKKHFMSDTVIGFFVGFNSGVAIPSLYYNF